jgi:hypothetical protein
MPRNGCSRGAKYTLKTTQRYADLDANDLREAINRLASIENKGVSEGPAS